MWRKVSETQARTWKIHTVADPLVRGKIKLHGFFDPGKPGGTVAVLLFRLAWVSCEAATLPRCPCVPWCLLLGSSDFLIASAARDPATFLLRKMWVVYALTRCTMTSSHPGMPTSQTTFVRPMCLWGSTTDVDRTDSKISCQYDTYVDIRQFAARDNLQLGLLVEILVRELYLPCLACQACASCICLPFRHIALAT